MIHVCSLAALPDTVKSTGASHILTIMAKVNQVQRPESVLETNHLKVSVDDITELAEGFVAPSEIHVEQVLNFVRGWDRGAPMVIHCWAGISRSTAGAFVTACALNPNRDEAAIARAIRDASATAMPNKRIVTIADQLLGRAQRRPWILRAPRDFDDAWIRQGTAIHFAIRRQRQTCERHEYRGHHIFR